jgi:hypothetical protein
MARDKERRRRGLGSAMRSFAGIMTAIAAIATATATLLGLRVHQQTQLLQQIRVTVTQQAQQIQQLKGQQPGAVGRGASAPTGGTSLAAGGRYLSDTNAVNDYGGLQTGQQVILNKQYPKSLLFNCDGGNGDLPDEVYDVSGTTTFAAEAGIPDNMSNATDVIATVTFTDQSGQRVGSPVQVSLGHPFRVTLNLSGVTQLGMTCVGRDSRSGQTASYFQVALGDARVF